MRDNHESPWPQRTLFACGAAVGTLVFGFALAGVIAEAPQQWSEGMAVFASDAGARLGFGALIAVLSTLPYTLLARAARRTGPPVFFACIGVLTLALQIWLSINALFLGHSSTASIAVLFIPFYLGAMVTAIWGLTWVARALLLRRRQT